MFEVVFTPQALKQLEKLGKKDQRKIRRVVDYLVEDPFAGKKMRGEYKGQYTMRAWPYRIIYTIQKKKVTVYVLAIGHRQGIYSF